MEVLGFVLAIFGLGAIAAAYAGFFLGVRARHRLSGMDLEVGALKDRQEILERRLADLKKEAGKPSVPSQAPAAKPERARPEQDVAAGAVSSKGEEGPVPGAVVPAREAAAPPVAFPIPPLTTAGPDSSPSKKTPVPAVAMSHPEAREDTAASQMPETAAAASPTEPPRGFDWEGFVGVKLFSWAAAVLVALAGAFFFKYSIENGWLTPPFRVALGLLVGAGLLVGCELKAARRYPVTANALDGAGISLLFGSIFAGHALWHLLGVVMSFVLMALVTAVAVALSIRRDSVFIALLGLIGGFATPALLSTGEDRPLGLFGYLLLLNAGLAWVAYRKRWPFLSVLSLVLTTAYQWGWVAKFLSEGKLPLAAGIFLVFPALSLVALALARRDEEGAGPTFERTASVAAVLPILFAFFLAAVPTYAAHAGLLYGFLLVVDLGLAVLAAARGLPVLHAAGAVSTLAILAVFCGTHRGPVPFGPTLAFTSVFFLLYLLAPRLAARAGRPLEGVGAQAVAAAPLLLFVFVVLGTTPAAAGAAPLLFGVLLALGAVLAAVTLGEGSVALFAAGVAFTLAAQLSWAVTHWKADRLLTGFTVVAVFGLFFLAAPVLALARGTVPEEHRSALRAALFLSLEAHVLLLFAVSTKELAVPPGPWIGVLALLLVASGTAALRCEAGGLAIASLAASQIVVAAWLGLLMPPLRMAVGLVAGAGLVGGGDAAPGPGTALAVAGGIGAWGVALFLFSRRERLFTAAAATGLLCASLVAILASFARGSPGVDVHAAAHAAFLVALLGVAWASEAHVLAVLAVVPAALAAFAWKADTGGADAWRERLVLATPLYLLVVAYPLLLGRRAGKSREPYLAAVLASVAYFILARKELLAGGFADRIGLLPIAQAVLMAILLARLRRTGVGAAEDSGRLAMVAGTLLAFVTVAIPLQLEKQWITIGWALLGAGLAWLYGRVPHRGLAAWALGLLAAVLVRLALNPEVLTYHPRTATPILNWYLYTYLVAAAAFFAARAFFSRANEPLGESLAPVAKLLPAGGALLLFLLLNIEIADFFSTGTAPAFRFLSARLGEGLTYTLGWAVFAIGLLVAGLLARSRPARIAALALLVVTILKCFLLDLARLGGLYRVGSFVGLAVCLALVAVLIQKFVLAREGARP